MRKFAFEDRYRYNTSYLINAKTKAKSERIDKAHIVIASDIDPDMIEIAKKNAKTL
jgi:23S rRNA G2445 N2-methylase RlmL